MVPQVRGPIIPSATKLRDRSQVIVLSNYCSDIGKTFDLAIPLESKVQNKPGFSKKPGF
jgi:hypothetical protein